MEPVNRRLTYQALPSDAADAATESHGDDELAAALEAQMATITSASRISIVKPFVQIAETPSDRLERAVTCREHATLDLQEERSEESADPVNEDFFSGSLLLSEQLSPPTSSTRKLGRDRLESGESLVSTLIEAAPERDELRRSSFATAIDDGHRAPPAQAEFFSEPVAPNRGFHHDAESTMSAEASQRHDDASSETKPTSTDLRPRQNARVLWLTFASSSSLVVVALGGAFATLGLSLWQVVVAVLVGVVVSAIPLGIGSFVGGRSKQTARATIGLVGDTVPALVAVARGALWTSAFLWVTASAAMALAIRGGWEVPGAIMQVGSVAVAGIFAVLVAVVGFQVLSRVQGILTIVSFALMVLTVVLTWGYVDLSRFVRVRDGSWTAVVGASIVVFCAVGLLWVSSFSDRARYRQPGAGHGSSSVWATVAASIPVLVVTAQGALLGVSDSAVPVGLMSDPATALTHLVPQWCELPLGIAIVTSLVATSVITAYSGGRRAAQSIVIHLSRRAIGVFGVMIVTVGVGVAATVCEPSVALVVRDSAATVTVPLAAWVGIYCADTLLQLRPINGASLFRLRGRHAIMRWINIIGLVAVTAVGLGFTSSTVAWLSWQGYLSAAVGFDSTDAWTNAHVGVLIALGCSLLVPLVGGITALRARERATP